MGQLLTTVPPPVEFVGQRAGGLAELPPAGTYSGKVTMERLSYRYDPDEEEWKLFRSIPLDGSGPAEAAIGADGSIALRRVGETANLFTGTLRVSEDVNATPRTTATLTAADGTTALYPYFLLNGNPPNLTIKPHGKTLTSGDHFVSFDQAKFEIDMD